LVCVRPKKIVSFPLPVTQYLMTVIQFMADKALKWPQLKFRQSSWIIFLFDSVAFRYVSLLWCLQENKIFFFWKNQNWPINGQKTTQKCPKNVLEIYQSITHKIAKFNFIIKRKFYFCGSIIMTMCSENQLNRIKT